VETTRHLPTAAASVSSTDEPKWVFLARFAARVPLSRRARDRTRVARSRELAATYYCGVDGLAGAAAGAALVVAGGFGIQKAGSEARTSFEA
jgi:hypothetical protein